MSFQWFDLILVAVMLISGLLAMMRGFTREALSLMAWIGAALAAYLAIRQPDLIKLVEPYVQKPILAQVIVGAVAFIIALIILSLISVKISDKIVDSAVGGFDRTLGLIFGLFRGYLLVVVAYLFYGWLLPTDKQDAWVAQAMSLPAVKAGGRMLLEVVPTSAAETLLSTALGPSTPIPPAPDDATAGDATQGADGGYRNNETQGLDNLIEGSGGSGSSNSPAQRPPAPAQAAPAPSSPAPAASAPGRGNSQ